MLVTIGVSILDRFYSSDALSFSLFSSLLLILPSFMWTIHLVYHTCISFSGVFVAFVMQFTFCSYKMGGFELLNSIRYRRGFPVGLVILHA